MNQRNMDIGISYLKYLFDFRRRRNLRSQIFSLLWIVAHSFIIISENLFMFPVITYQKQIQKEPQSDARDRHWSTTLKKWQITLAGPKTCLILASSLETCNEPFRLRLKKLNTRTLTAIYCICCFNYQEK